MKFPIVLNDEQFVEPSASLYYVVGENGVFQVRETPLYRAVTQVESSIPGLLPVEESVELSFPSLPAALLGEVLAFFRAVYEEHGGEAMVILFVEPQSGRYAVGVPPQTVPGYRLPDGRWRGVYRLDYGVCPRPQGMLRFGTIHSHGDLPAYASSTDCDDERFEDGLNVVFGHVHRTHPSRSAAFTANRVRFELDPDDVLERCHVPEHAARPEWMARVERDEGKPPFAAYIDWFLEGPGGERRW